MRELPVRLKARRAEIEQAVLARVYSVSDPSEVEDPEYAIGLKRAVVATLDYLLAAIDTPAREPAPLPDKLLAQARVAARNGVSLDTVLRRYSAGHALLGEFLIREAEQGEPLPSAELRRALRSLSALFDHLVSSISVEYTNEAERRPDTPARLRAERVRTLLAGEPVDPGELRYELDGWHLAAVAVGPGAMEGLRDLGAAMDSRLLLVCPDDEESVWVWLGGRDELSACEALRLAQRSLPAEVSFTLGEPGWGIEGWRLSHRQAKAAMLVAKRLPERSARYADVALLASTLQDDVLAPSLRQLYLAPLARGPDDGETLRETLRAYFTAQRNVSSTASALGVSRKTINARLRVIEQRLGRPLSACTAELEAALRLEELGDLTPVARIVPRGH